MNEQSSKSNAYTVERDQWITKQLVDEWKEWELRNNNDNNHYDE